MKVVNQVLASLGLAKHPDKTFIGRIEKGFDWLGYRISPAGLTLATKTLKNFVARVRQLDEREPRAATAAYRLGVYVRRWFRWMLAGLSLINQDLPPVDCDIRPSPAVQIMLL
jgi:hypothetical protein